ncbi:hypothetical protein FRX31_035421, partial [Thalictrum thalictroides]
MPLPLTDKLYSNESDDNVNVDNILEDQSNENTPFDGPTVGKPVQVQVLSDTCFFLDIFYKGYILTVNDSALEDPTAACNLRLNSHLPRDADFFDKKATNE